jgi:hypothetical protein
MVLASGISNRAATDFGVDTAGFAFVAGGTVVIVIVTMLVILHVVDRRFKDKYVQVECQRCGNPIGYVVASGWREWLCHECSGTGREEPVGDFDSDP